MQLLNPTIVTTTDEIADLQRHITLNNLSGQINLTLNQDGSVHVWQPVNAIMEESVTPKPHPKAISMRVISDVGAMCDEQPTDNINIK